MAKKPKRGFKAPKNYEPNRGKKQHRKGGNRAATGGRRGYGDDFADRREQRFSDRGKFGYRADRQPGRYADHGTRGGFRGDHLDERRGSDYRRDYRGEGRGERRHDFRGERHHDFRGERREDFRFDRRDDYRGDRRTDYRGEDRRERRDDYRGEARRERREFGRRNFEQRDRQGFERDRADRWGGERSGRDRDFREERDFQRHEANRFSNARKKQRGDRGAWSDFSPNRHRDGGSTRGAKQGGYQPPEDVVLDRLEAKQTSAADVVDSTFADLGLGAGIVEALAELGATKPFPIQAATIPDVLSGVDVLGRGRTGSGKTIAFGASLIERLLQLKSEGLFDNDPSRPKRKRVVNERRERTQGRAPKALILAPTRELALQIDRTVQPIARAVGFFTTQVVGGAPIERQQHALRRGVDIVVGTPGRVEDLIERGDLQIGQVAIAVLDEADHMAELGFVEPVQRILRGIAPNSQKLLFSATLDQQVAKLVSEFLQDPAVHEVAGEAHGNIDHHVLVVLREDKDEVLQELVRGATGPTIVFTRTRAYAEMVRELCEDAGVMAVDLHGNLNQNRRERNLKRFTDGKVNVLVATDVAARGIHVDDVALVVQADPPDDYKSYLHRAGRTGRAGRDGTVVTVIPRNRRRRTEQLFKNAQLEPAYFGDFEPGDQQDWAA
ncbi:DEAD/DEAH box helicase [Leucobacter sp. OH1287]|uniref:DEAD/DEAH box helicase n=1 Tax=Leucobacter sp. OH1287 TaxID=2491049 RepID=UPI001F29A6FB|nr:DEAD/DEAH box helicase [Leucobacter sp. OH1287]